MSVEHKIYKSAKGTTILLRTYRGIIKINNIMDSWNFTFGERIIPENKINGVIINLNDCKLDIDLKEFEILIDYLKKQDSLKSVKISVIYNKPEKLVFPMLAEFRYSALHIKSFYTIDAAEEWLNY